MYPWKEEESWNNEERISANKREATTTRRKQDHLQAVGWRKTHQASNGGRAAVDSLHASRLQLIEDPVKEQMCTEHWGIVRDIRKTYSHKIMPFRREPRKSDGMAKDCPESSWKNGATELGLKTFKRSINKAKRTCVSLPQLELCRYIINTAEMQCKRDKWRLINHFLFHKSSGCRAHRSIGLSCNFSVLNELRTKRAIICIRRHRCRTYSTSSDRIRLLLWEGFKNQ